MLFIIYHCLIYAFVVKQMDHSNIVRNHEYTEVFQRIPFRLQLVYGVGHVLNDICASMWFTYLLVYFNYVLQFNSWQSGLVLFIGQVTK